MQAAFVNSGAYLQPEKLEKFQSIICFSEDKIGLSPSTSDGILMNVGVKMCSRRIWSISSGVQLAGQPSYLSG